MNVAQAFAIIGMALGLFLGIIAMMGWWRFVNGPYRIAEAIENHARIQIGESVPQRAADARRRNVRR